MVSSGLLLEGVNLMLFGMGFVFLFLTALVGVTSTMSKVVNRFFPDPLPAAPAPKAAAPAATASGDTELVAAITAAIKMHRNKL
ncbi:OadG family protein [Endozoicomonas euniceicola]|uniref:Probable oxaloacetate decarboxylase gamma chain n=1 Tax=Endozoicomonas euniceicola TaxID=1234143 RepID=A0ABY6GW46_9GAMM|nr:OadG family protein [Endozoicomonas euniceicola]UYM16992.1 OadG family protein [Endozoicomonas euniceicola]